MHPLPMCSLRCCFAAFPSSWLKTWFSLHYMVCSSEAGVTEGARRATGVTPDGAAERRYHECRQGPIIHQREESC